MYIEILKHSLDRIFSLEHYYEIEVENVLKISYEGAKPHMLGAKIDSYLNARLRSRKDELESEQFKQLEDVVLKHIEVIGSSEQEDIKRISYRFLSQEDMEKVGNVKEEKKLWDLYADMPSIHGDSTLIMLITRFEEFVSDYLKALYIQFSQIYLDNKQLKFSEIVCADINEIKKNLLCREVDEKMGEKYTEWFKIYKNHGMICQSFEHDLSILSEIYARRNIIVHNSGMVNSQYLKFVPKSKAKLGEKLFVDETYMKTAFDTIYRIIILMLIESSKLNEKNEDEYLESIFTVLFDFLLRQNMKCVNQHMQNYLKRMA